MSIDSISLVSARTESDGAQEALRLQEQQLRLAKILPHVEEVL